MGVRGGCWVEGVGSLRKAKMWMGCCESEMVHLIQLWVPSASDSCPLEYSVTEGRSRRTFLFT